MANEVFKLRKRPKKDPLSWIRQGEYGEGDPPGESNIRGVTNRPLKELLENDLELLRYLEKALTLVSGVEGSRLNQEQHFDEIGSGLEHLDMNINPNRRFYQVSEITHQDHNDTNESIHQDHTDHQDSPGISETIHIDQDHEDQTINNPHSDYQDHANSHGDHLDMLSKPHADINHGDHFDHLDYSLPGEHGDHKDHANTHGDYSYPPPHGHLDHSDHLDFNDHSDCYPLSFYYLLTGGVCSSEGLHYDYLDHGDYPTSYTSHVDGHGLAILCFGYCHEDHGDVFDHVDGHKEWFYWDTYYHGDYPPPHTDHRDSFTPNHSDHGDNTGSIHSDHHDHGDWHQDHSDIINQTGSVYVNYSDHIDYPHSDFPHLDHNDHSDFHHDQPVIHFDESAHEDHLDTPEIRHTDHSDIPHEDSGSPHLDYYPPESSYHLDYTPVSGAYHYDSGEEHYDLSLVPEAHLDSGLASPRDLSEGTYEEVYKWVLHGDRSIHSDYDGHGDLDPGEEDHSDHSDILYHEDYPHGDTPYQDYFGPGHLDHPPEIRTEHGDHTDGLPPNQLHSDSFVIREVSPHQDHVDTIHTDYHLDNPHLDATGHLDITNTVTTHTDYSHQDHLDHSDWDHEDHSDIDLLFGKWKYIVSYSDHGDTSIHYDIPHTDGTGHLDYIPEHDDHGDHADLEHGDAPEQTIHEDTTVPGSHYDISIPHEDFTANHNDFASGGHADYHADHSDHGDFTVEERHGDFTSYQPHIDYPHYDHSDIQVHSDGPRGPQHEDLYYHLDIAHTDRVEHTDRTISG